MNQEILKLIQEGYCLVTPTRRLSRHLVNAYSNYQLSSGRQAWESAEIVPWNAWLLRFQAQISPDSEDDAYVLNSHQRQNLWLGIIRESEYSSQLLQLSSVARQAVNAWEISHQWCMPLFPSDVYINQDAYAFQFWANSYLDLCSKNNWTDEACFPDVLIKRLQGSIDCSAMKIAMVGHDELYPQQSALLEQARNCGARVEVVKDAGRQQNVRAVVFADAADEINAAANWARSRIASGEVESIGIVVPKLTQLRSDLLQHFDDVLMSGDVLGHADVESRPYSIVLGQSLNKYPVVAAAFKILQLLNHSLSLEEASDLICSPWIKSARGEQSRRHLLDAALREYGETSFSLEGLLYLVENLQLEEMRCSVLLQCLDAWKTTMADYPGTHTARSWAEKITELLDLFGWPGERPLNSQEFQTIEAWQDLLLQLSSLDVVAAKMGSSAVLAQLAQLASTYSFQPETAETALQIVGPAAAAGMDFDHLWLLGMHEDAWPAVMEANPFIPLPLQLRYELPASSAENRLRHGQRLTQILLRSSSDVVISYPAYEADRLLRPSPMLRKLFQEPTEFIVERLPAYAQQLKQLGEYEFLQDEHAIPIILGQPVRGGSGVFKDQAACPFRAFARHRLRAYGLASADIGLAPPERGSLLHDVMQSVFEGIDDLESLQALGEEKEKLLISRSVEKVIQKYRRQWPQTFSPAFMQIETDRLTALVFDWLKLEKQRAYFRVLACELKQTASFADIEVNTRIDRVDELADGRLVLLDYKTGVVNPSGWFGERPEDPQLPLYTILQDREVAALAFAKLAIAESRYAGISNGDDLLPGVSSFEKNRNTGEQTSWDELIANWRDLLLQLGHDFRQGRAVVDPKDATTCRYCDLQSFCRIYEIENRPGYEESQ